MKCSNRTNDTFECQHGHVQSILFYTYTLGTILLYHTTMHNKSAYTIQFSTYRLVFNLTMYNLNVDKHHDCVWFTIACHTTISQCMHIASACKIKNIPLYINSYESAALSNSTSYKVTYQSGYSART